MKLATFHKSKGDNVHFFKGLSSGYSDRFGDIKWDRIYISSIFTFNYEHTLKAIQLAKRHAESKRIFLGGVATALLHDHFNALGVNFVKGLLDARGKINVMGDSEGG